MKQVMETYGQTIVAIMIMGALLLFWGGLSYRGSQATGNPVGILAEKSLENPALSEGENNAFLQYKENSHPIIVFIDDYEIETGKFVEVRNCIKASDYAGREVLVHVTEVISAQESSLRIHEMGGREFFYFEVPGIYRVCVEAKDGDNRTASAIIKIPVNKGESD